MIDEDGSSVKMDLKKTLPYTAKDNKGVSWPMLKS